MGVIRLFVCARTTLNRRILSENDSEIGFILGTAAWISVHYLRR
eukprot:COSAG06_NODE_56171_length_286_cov_0.705882_1_plen_43_part_10